MTNIPLQNNGGAIVRPWQRWSYQERSVVVKITGQRALLRELPQRDV